VRHLLPFRVRKSPDRAARDLALKQARLLRHRGPDWSGMWAGGSAVMAHERLAIVDVLHGAQPLALGRRTSWCSPSTARSTTTRAARAGSRARCVRTDSDCEVISAALRAEGPTLLIRLRGMFAFASVRHREGRLADRARSDRDHPALRRPRKDGSLAVASELKALLKVCDSIEEFPPGHYQSRRDPKPVRYHTRDWFTFDAVPDHDVEPLVIRDALADAVHSHLMTDVPYGVLLSGGLDSSVIGALASQYADQARRIGGQRGGVVAAPAFVRDRSCGLAGSRRGQARGRKGSARSITASSSPCRRGSTPYAT
jgi:asparagine synthase (glutamine-hydrolysing)